MANIKNTLDELLSADGAMCAAIVDSSSGMMLGSAGSGVDLEIAAAGNSEVVRSKVKVMRQLGLNDVIDDILITLGKQYHIIRPSARKEGSSSTSSWTAPSPTWRWPAARCRTWTRNW